MKCISCSHEQESGNFCAKCGTAMNSSVDATQQGQSLEVEQIAATHSEPVVAAQTGQAAAPKQPNQNVEQVKAMAQNYIGAFGGLLKKPATASTNEGLFVNGIISLVIVNLILGLTTTTILNKFYKDVLGYVDDIMGVFGGGGASSSNAFGIKHIIIFTIVYALLSLISIAVVFFANKLFVEERSFKSIFIGMTNFYPLTIVVIAVGYLLALIGALKLSIIVLLASFSLVLTLIPLFKMSVLMENKETKFDKFFVYVIAFVAISILNYFVTYISFSLFLESIDIGNYFLDSLW